MKVNKEKFDNLDIIGLKIKEVYPQFKGFHGTADNLKVVGITDEMAVVEMGKLNITQLINDKKNEEENIQKNELLKLLDDTVVKNKIKAIRAII